VRIEEGRGASWDFGVVEPWWGRMGIVRRARGGARSSGEKGGVNGGGEDGDVDDGGGRTSTATERRGVATAAADSTPESGVGGGFFKNGRICVGARATVGAAREEADTHRRQTRCQRRINFLSYFHSF
jgi:hypothetical protein